MSPRPVAVPAGGFRRIAVLRLSSLGDVVLALPAVHALRRTFPDAALGVWVKEEYADVFRHDPAVTHVRRLERDARRLEDLVSMSAELEDQDLIVDLHASVRTRVLTFRQRAVVLRAPTDRWARARWVHARWTHPRPARTALARYAAPLARIGVAVGEPPRLAVGPEAERWAEEWLGGMTSESLGRLAGSLGGPAGPLGTPAGSLGGPAGPLGGPAGPLGTPAGPLGTPAGPLGGAAPVAFCPAARHPTKCWPEEHWLQLLALVRAAGRPVVVVSTAAERRGLPRLAAVVDADRGARWCEAALDRIAALLGRAAVAVTSDSGLMHVAAARATRVVALFGSTAPELGFAPAGPGHVVLCRHEPCQPCTLHGRARCPKGHFRCMRLLAPAEVLAAVNGILARPFL